MAERGPVVLVVGAGPTGLTAAMELSRMGVPVRLVDRLTAPSTTSRALAVQARTVELMAQRGLAEEMVRLGNKGQTVAIYATKRTEARPESGMAESDAERSASVTVGRQLGVVKLEEIPSEFNGILLLSQAETERLLREQVERQGVRIERGVELVAVAGEEGQRAEGQPKGVKAILRGPDGVLEEFAADCLISAEGAHSVVRRTLGVPFQGVSLPQSYALGDLYLDSELPQDGLSVFLAENGLLAMFPMSGGRFRMIATDHTVAEDGKEAPELPELQRLFDRSSHIPARLRDLVWSSRFRINSRMVDRLRIGAFFFGGDSAHIHSPVGGQGMNTGIQDMINLGWKLAMVLRGDASPELLETYGQDRLPVIRGVVGTTERATDTLNSEHDVVQGLLRTVAPIALHTKVVQQTATGIVSQTAANYRGSSLSDTHHATGDLRAGDRVPHLLVRTAETGEGQTVWAQTLLDPSRCTLLLVGEAAQEGDAIVAELALWADLVTVRRIAPPEGTAEGERFVEEFGDRGGLYLVRPDGYLGYVGSAATRARMIGWLQRWFPRAAARA